MGYHHDVFVSFRGRDVRYKFVDHLFAALRRKNVRPFRDTTDLGRGVDIEEGIRWAIERSRLYVVVLSPNYASSPWCLDELVRMMKCASRGGKKKKTVFPVFYHVSPEDLFDCYMDDVDRHRMKYSHERVNGWIQALERVVGIAGWVVTSDRHDVFVSFRGRDVRYKFADHLFAALRRNNVKAFRDCSDLRRGVIIEEGIQQAIERSRLYVVILTQNYASSHWCLDELVKVMKCSNHGKKGIVFPIFYHVSPADLFGCYIDDFDHHMIKYSYERVNNWIQALNCIVEISGWEVTDN
ncbi:Disease resistance protein RPV1, partial [Linum perenne]